MSIIAILCLAATLLIVLMTSVIMLIKGRVPRLGPMRTEKHTRALGVFLLLFSGTGLFLLLPALTPGALIDQLAADTLRSACTGQAIPQAAVYTPGKPGPHRIRIIWMKGIAPAFSKEWGSGSIEDTQLVACVLEDTVKIESCKYVAVQDAQRTASIVREQWRATITLVEAKTGKTVTTWTIDGRLPPACPQLGEFGLKYGEDRQTLIGDLIPLNEIEGWLTGYANP